MTSCRSTKLLIGRIVFAERKIDAPALLHLCAKRFCICIHSSVARSTYNRKYLEFLVLIIQIPTFEFRIPLIGSAVAFQVRATENQSPDFQFRIHIIRNTFEYE